MRKPHVRGACMSGVSELYVNKPSLTFLGFSRPKSETPLSVIGVPLDMTSTFTPGTRFAPYYVRLASQSIETYSLRSMIDLSDVGVHDEGDIVISYGDLSSSLRAIELVAEELFKEGRLTVFIGGEHLILYPIVKALVKVFGTKTCLIVFDAHLDFRHEYLGVKLSHACTIRRVSEVLPYSRVALIGVRALSSEELRDVKRSRIRYITSHDLMRLSSRDVLNRLIEILGDCSYTYVSVDLDVLDPSYAPAVSTPEPEGISPHQLLDILNLLTTSVNLVGLDICEYVPLVDVNNITAFVGAKIAIEALTYMYRSFTSRTK